MLNDWNIKDKNRLRQGLIMEGITAKWVKGVSSGMKGLTRVPDSVYLLAQPPPHPVYWIPYGNRYLIK